MPNTQDLTLHDLFRIRDALAILDLYGMVNQDLKDTVANEITQREAGFQTSRKESLI